MHLQSSKLAVPMSPEVAGFAAVLEARLRLSGFQDKWRDLPLEMLQGQLYAKAEALLKKRGNEAFQTAIIVGLLAMMVADKAALEAKGKAHQPATTPKVQSKARAKRQALHAL